MLNLFGVPRLEIAGAGSRTFPTKGFVLVAMLRLAVGETLARTTTAERLWEGTATDPGSNLRQLLASIRRIEHSHGIRFVEADRRQIWLPPDRHHCDLDDFLSVSEIATEAELERYVAQFGSDFLSGMEDHASSDLAAWVAEQRQALFARFTRIAQRGAVTVGGPVAVATLKQLLECSPYDEAILRSLVMEMMQHGTRQDIAETYRRFAERLETDLGTPPESATTLLVAQAVPTMATELRIAGSPRLTGSVQQPQDETVVPRLLILPPRAGPVPARPHEMALARALVEDTTLTLSRLRSFRVYAPHSAFRWGEADGDVSVAAPDADFLVHTRILPADGPGGSSRIAYTLVAEKSGEVLVSDLLRFTPSDLPHRYMDFVQTVSGQIARRIDEATLTAFERSGDASAYTHYLLGRERLRPYDLRSVRAARQSFKRALDVQPGYFPATHMLAHTLNMEWFALGRPDPAPLIEAQRLAEGLIADNPTAPEGHWERGISALYLHQIEEAIEFLDAAEQRAPNHADILADGADALVHLGDHKRARARIATALELNPLAPDDYYWISGSSAFFLGQYAEALSMFERLAGTRPTARIEAACHAMLGNTNKALQCRDAYLEDYPDFKVETWSTIIPMRDPQDIAHMHDAMRRAGFA